MNLPELPKGECAIDYGGLTIVYDAEALRAYAEEAVKQEREAAKPLIDAAEKALHEMCHTNSPRYSFTDAVDELDAALSEIRSRTAVPAKE